MKKEEEPDYLLRTSLYATVQYVPKNNAYLFNGHLPKGYEYCQQYVTFSAGYREKYVINGKEYEINDEHPAEEAKKFILADLLEEGLNEKEAMEFIDEIPTKEGSWRIDDKEATEWLIKHPEFIKEFEVVMATAEEETKKEVEEIDERELKRGEGKSFRK